MQHSLSATLLNACKLMSEDPFIKIFFFEQFTEYQTTFCFRFTPLLFPCCVALYWMNGMPQ